MGRTKTPAERFATMPADKHGVRSGYTYWGCRCDACTRADLAYRRPITERGPIPDTAHATRAGYRYWGCRCDACIFANRTAAHQRRDARRGPAPEGPTVTRRYLYRIDTTPAVRAALVRVFGGCRFIHNAYIAMARDAFANGDAHPSLGAASKSLITQGRANPETPWLKELPTIALRGALKDAVQAYENFFSSVTGKRQGRPVARPVFHRRRARQTARFYEVGFRIRGGWQNTKRGGGRLYLSKVGTVSVNWHRALPSHPSSVTIIKAADGAWWASFVVSVPTSTPLAPVHPDRVAGIDLGLTDLATIAYSDGTREKISAPRYYRAAERKLARAQKKLSRAQRGSKNREKLRVEVARIHTRTANLRRDHARQLISRLIRENQTISLETLSVAAMVRGRYGKSITDAGWSQFVTELEAKAAITGRTVVRADRFFPSTRLCAICSTKSGPSSPEVRQWACPCGVLLDRDYNAATNLMVLALAPGKVERLNACGRDIRLRLAGAVSDEAGTRRNEVTS